ncbi:hypothetical protein WJX74_001390 [Apatococcus lobatus]|uniref:Uncharacterized protein n=1 Tax=Apatococcus lobatus TaxID=904363 RepID=A0AAW1Q7K8_9CHLO
MVSGTSIQSQKDWYAKEQRCPLCRAPAPQKRSIQDGAIAHRHRCAAAIQAAWRAFCGRRRYIQALLLLPAPVGERDRRRWYALQLQERSRRLLKEMQSRQDDVESLLGELDASLALSRQVFSTPQSSDAAAASSDFGQEAFLSGGVLSAVVSASGQLAAQAGPAASCSLLVPACDW